MAVAWGGGDLTKQAMETHDLQQFAGISQNRPHFSNISRHVAINEI